MQWYIILIIILSISFMVQTLYFSLKIKMMEEKLKVHWTSITELGYDNFKNKLEKGEYNK